MRPRTSLALCLALALSLGGAGLASGQLHGGEADRAAIAAINDLDERGRLGQVTAEALQRLARSSEPTVRRMAAYFSARRLLAQRQVQPALKQWNDLLANEPVGSELWALLKLAIGDGLRTAEKPDLTGALLSYQDLLGKRPQGLTAFKAAVASGEVFAAQGDNAQATKAYAFALSLLEHDAYLDAARTGMGADTLRERLSALKPRDTKPAVGEDRDLFRRAEDHRLKGDWLNALRLYRELTDRFPTSDTIPAATWAYGDCLLTSGRLENAIRHWSDFVAADASGPWRAQTLISLGDVLLERRFDLAAAKGFFDRAATVYDACVARQVPGWTEMGYAIFQRQGLLAYVANRPNDAMGWFAKASLLNPPHSYRSAQGDPPSGLDQLIDRLRRGDSLTPSVVREGRSEAALIILLADIHQAADDLAKAEPLYRRVVENDHSWIEQVANSTSDGTVGSRLLPPPLPRQPTPKLDPTPAQVGWATYQIGRIAHTRFELTKAVEAYLKVGDTYKDCAWADAALVRAGILYFSNLKKPGEALGCFSRVVALYPAGDEAQRAAMYIGIIYAWSRNFAEAKVAYRDFLQRYPQSPYAKAVSNDLLPKVEAQLSAAKKGP